MNREGGLPKSYFETENKMHQILSNGGTENLNRLAKKGQKIEADNLGLEVKPKTDDEIAEFYRLKAQADKRKTARRSGRA